MSSKKPNIILIVADSLRAGNLGCYGKGANSPFMDLLSKESLLFENLYCCWNTTDSSLTSILSGKYPVSHGITNHGDRLSSEELDVFDKTETRLLSEILKENGYRTMTVDWMGRWQKRGYDFYGYKSDSSFLEKVQFYFFKAPFFYFKYIMNHKGILSCYAEGKKQSIMSLIKNVKGVLKTFWFSKELALIQDSRYVMDLAKKLIARNENDEPYFMMLHLWDNHNPYNSPYKDKGVRDKKELLVSKYNGSIRYVDNELKRLFEHLKSIGELDNTMIIITSDHGESLTEHDIFFDHHGLYEVNTHCPLIISYPAVFKEGKRVKGFVQHIDIVPTILELLGVDSASYDLDGIDLMPLINGDVSKVRDFVYNEESYVQRKRAIRTSRYRYITALDGEEGVCRYCNKVHSGREELYDLQSDPDEIFNIVDSKKEIRDDLNKRLNELVSKLSAKRDDKVKGKRDLEPSKSGYNKGDEDKEIEKKLKSLGYL